MDAELTPQEKQIIRVLQEGLPLADRPFQILAVELKITEEELINQINSFLKRGLIRRFGATLRQKDVGFTANAMVVWDVPDERTAEAGRILAGFPQVTHCYQRPRRPGWKYNLFTMIHGPSRDHCLELAQKLSQAAGISNYSLLYSTRELKKSSMRYFV